MIRVLVIDDDRGVRRSVEAILERAGFLVEAAESGERGFELAREGTFDVILSDLKMPGISGIEVLKRLRDRRIDSVLIIMTAFGTIESAVEAMQHGAADFVQKPLIREELVMRIRTAAERRQLVRQVELLQRHVRPAASIEAILGTSDAIERVRTFVRRAAARSGTVLITGDTGTGKELVARAIHATSPRRDRPFVVVNCAALTESLLEAELFGHARGAFTGATGVRVGLIEHAHLGTLFLDEVGSMQPSLQAKLLRALEDQEIRRVGENESRKVDVRFVAATNTHLSEAVASGEFREDLFYRLNVLHVHLPPLRERPGDVVLLVDCFLERYGRPSGITRMSEPARAALEVFDFPGNVRQLEHVIQRAVAVAHAPCLELGDLPDEVITTAARAEAPVAGGVATARLHAERERLLAALERQHGDLSRVASDLGISRTTLWRLMRKHQVSARRPR